MGEPRKLPLFERAEQFADRIAVRAELASAACYNMCQLHFSYPSSRECHGPANPIPQIACGPDTYTYRDLLTAASTIAVVSKDVETRITRNPKKIWHKK